MRVRRPVLVDAVSRRYLGRHRAWRSPFRSIPTVLVLGLIASSLAGIPFVSASSHPTDGNITVSVTNLKVGTGFGTLSSPIDDNDATVTITVPANLCGKSAGAPASGATIAIDDELLLTTSRSDASCVYTYGVTRAQGGTIAAGHDAGDVAYRIWATSPVSVVAANVEWDLKVFGTVTANAATSTTETATAWAGSGTATEPVFAGTDCTGATELYETRTWTKTVKTYTNKEVKVTSPSGYDWVASGSTVSVMREASALTEGASVSVGISAIARADRSEDTYTATEERYGSGSNTCYPGNPIDGSDGGSGAYDQAWTSGGNPAPVYGTDEVQVATLLDFFGALNERQVVTLDNWDSDADRFKLQIQCGSTQRTTGFIRKGSFEGETGNFTAAGIKAAIDSALTPDGGTVSVDTVTTTSFRVLFDGGACAGKDVPEVSVTEAAEYISYIGAGAADSGTGAVTPGLPANMQQGDLMVMFVETANEAVTAPQSGSPLAGDGWTQAGSSPQGHSLTDATRLTVFYKFRGASQAAVTVPDPGDHVVAQIIALRAVDMAAPFNATDGSAASVATTSPSVAGITTTAADAFVFAVIGNGRDTNSAQFSNWTNTTLSTAPSYFAGEILDAFTNSSNGGGFGVAVGRLSTAGSTGATGATSADSRIPVYWAGAVAPRTTSLPAINSVVSTNGVASNGLQLTYGAGTAFPVSPVTVVAGASGTRSAFGAALQTAIRTGTGRSDATVTNVTGTDGTALAAASITGFTVTFPAFAAEALDLVKSGFDGGSITTSIEGSSSLVTASATDLESVSASSVNATVTLTVDLVPPSLNVTSEFAPGNNVASQGGSSGVNLGSNEGVHGSSGDVRVDAFLLDDENAKPAAPTFSAQVATNVAFGNPQSGAFGKLAVNNAFLPVPCNAPVGEYLVEATLFDTVDLIGNVFATGSTTPVGLLEITPGDALSTTTGFWGVNGDGTYSELTTGFTATKNKGNKRITTTPGTLHATALLDVTGRCSDENPSVSFAHKTDEQQRVTLGSFNAGDSFRVNLNGVPGGTVSFSNLSSPTGGEAEIETALGLIDPGYGKDSLTVEVDDISSRGFTVTFTGQFGEWDVPHRITLDQLAGGVSTPSPAVEVRKGGMNTFDLTLEAPPGFHFEKTGTYFAKVQAGRLLDGVAFSYTSPRLQNPWGCPGLNALDPLLACNPDVTTRLFAATGGVGTGGFSASGIPLTGEAAASDATVYDPASNSYDKTPGWESIAPAADEIQTIALSGFDETSTYTIAVNGVATVPLGAISNPLGTLAAEVTDASTSITVAETLTPPATPFDIFVGSEQMTVNARSLVSGSTYAYSVARGVSPTAHVSGDPVRYYTSDAVVKRAIELARPGASVTVLTTATSATSRTLSLTFGDRDGTIESYYEGTDVDTVVSVTGPGTAVVTETLRGHGELLRIRLDGLNYLASGEGNRNSFEVPADWKIFARARLRYGGDWSTLSEIPVACQPFRVLSSTHFDRYDDTQPFESATDIDTYNFRYAPGGPIITTQTLPTATVGAPYSFTLAGVNGAVTDGAQVGWSATGLPAGFSLSPAGVLAGTPTAAMRGLNTFDVTLTGSGSCGSVTKTLALSVGILEVTSSTLSEARETGAYTTQLEVARLGVASATSFGELADPIDADDAVITVTETVAPPAVPFDVFVDNEQMRVTARVASGPNFNYTVTRAVDGTGAATHVATTKVRYYSWSLAPGYELPTGLVLGADGVISGTPSAGTAGTYSFTVRVIDSAGNGASKTVALTIRPAVEITSSTLPNATVGSSYTTTLSVDGVSGRTFTWSLAAGSLPTGLSLGTDGVISGTPAEETAGGYSFTVQVTDSAGNSATKDFSLTVEPLPPAG